MGHQSNNIPHSGHQRHCLKMNTYLAITSLTLLSAGIAAAGNTCSAATSLGGYEDWVPQTALAFEAQTDYQKGWTMEVTFDREFDGEFIAADWGKKENCGSSACPEGIDETSCSVCTFQVSDHKEYGSPHATISKGDLVTITIDIELYDMWKVTQPEPHIVSAIINKDNIDYCK